MRRRIPPGSWKARIWRLRLKKIVSKEAIPSKGWPLEKFLGDRAAAIRASKGGVEVRLLLWGETVDGQAQSSQLGPADGVINLGGDIVELLFQVVSMLHQPFGGQGLDGEGHIHDLRRVAVARG